ncbi:MAG: moderate conductance mechanosensitive channel [Solirubrobacteraceae bacterium]|nr:moderate conductance mechanosensitive channel [Solirubrobacteraceae bacterium]
MRVAQAAGPARGLRPRDAAVGGRLVASRAVLLALADISATELRDACGSDPDAACRWILERTGNRTLAEIADVVVGTPLTIVLIALGAVIVNRLVARVIERGLRSLSTGIVHERMTAVRRRTPGAVLQTPETSLRAEQRIMALTSILRSVAGFVILLLAGFMVLSALGVDVAPLLAGAGVVGVALGFGSQSLVKDFLSGLFILAEDQFGVGDVVDLDGDVAGTVEAVSLRTTRLRSADGTVWHVPNGAIVRVGNKSQHWSRALLDVEVDADADLDHAEHVIARVAGALYDAREDILELPEVRGIEKRGEDAVAIRLLVKTLPSDRDAVSSELRRRLTEEFAREGIRPPAAQAAGDEDAGAGPGPADGGAAGAGPGPADGRGGRADAAGLDPTARD